MATVSPIPGLSKDPTQQNDKINELVRNLQTVTTATTVGAVIHGATAKASLADNDKFAIIDSAASNVLKTVLWSVIKTTLATWVASVTATFTNKTIDANGTGNSISNLETADFAANVVDTDGTLAANSDTRLASQKAVKTYVDASAAAVGLTQIATWTFSGAIAAVEFDDIPATYSSLYISFSAVSFASAGSEMRLRISTDNGVSYNSASGDYYTGGTAGTGIALTTAIGASGDTFKGAICIHAYGSVARKLFSSVTISSDAADGLGIGIGMIEATAAINSIQFTGDGGSNFDAGTITVYGMA
jgi:hypothetical protein